MSEFITVARPYARAIFELAAAEKTLPKWSDTLALVSELVAVPDMRQALENPALTKQQKADLLIEAAGDALDEQAKNLLRTMAENSRLLLLPEVAALYEQMRSEAEGTIEAEVVSAHALSPEQQEKIVDSLKRRLGRDVRLRIEIDEDLLGGAIVKAGDLVIDGSVRGRLEQLASTLTR